MSTSKKPGTDLAALKARLAKKNKKAEPAPAPAAAAPAPQAPLPAPGQPAAAPAYEPPPADALPPPGQPAPPPQAQPAAPPAQQYEAPSAQQYEAPPAQAAAAPQAATDDPFGGGGGAFDPSDGLIDSGGEVVSGKSSIGLMIFVGILGAGLGCVAGFLGHKIVEKKEVTSVATAKGEQMAGAVAEVISARTDVSLALEDLEKKMATDPAGAAKDIDTLVTEKFDPQVKIDSMFGWQLGGVNSNGVKRTFELYDESTRLKKDLQYLSAFLSSQSNALKAGGGPSSFAVMFKPGGVKLVAALEPMCGETPEALATCPADKRSEAKGYKVLDAVGGEPKVILKGVEEGQGMMVFPDGGVYAYAVGMEPNRNAIIMRNGLLARVKDHLEAMTKVEKTAVKALEKYASDPNVDGNSPQPDPEASE